ncbi:MAG: hypothetical protein LC733_09395 [Actinobacteria bacterium]|nr:hypothetical protein [Actinomycetota bacterium]
MRRRRWAVLGLGFLLTPACRSDSPDVTAPATSTSPTTLTSAVPTNSGPASTAPAASGTVTFRARDVQLANSEESDNGFRVLIGSPDEEVAVVLGGIPSPNRVVFVCPATELERRVPAPGCLTPEPGEVVRVSHAPDRRGVEVVQVGATGAGAAGNSTLLSEVAVTYTPASREVQLRLPPVPPGEATPSFVLTPAGAGDYRASANWPGGGSTTVALTMTVGTKVVSQIEGSSVSQLDGNVSPPEEGVLRLRNPGSTTLTGLTISALFP